ncbi:MAG: terminase small subunit [Oscillospiraceae bacterium]|nr:terminase small subunit [Oscillospiraceae bacterium]
MDDILSPAQLLGELRAIAMARATDFLTVRDGALEIRSTSELTPEQCAAIASVERSTGGLKVKFYDKLKALELLGKYMGLFENRAAWQSGQENNLLEVLLKGTAQEVDTNDIPEIQQAAAAGHDLVEPPKAEGK